MTFSPNFSKYKILLVAARLFVLVKVWLRHVERSETSHVYLTTVCLVSKFFAMAKDDVLSWRYSKQPKRLLVHAKIQYSFPYLSIQLLPIKRIKASVAHCNGFCTVYSFAAKLLVDFIERFVKIYYFFRIVKHVNLFAAMYQIA